MMLYFLKVEHHLYVLAMFEKVLVVTKDFNGLFFL